MNFTGQRENDSTARGKTRRSPPISVKQKMYSGGQTCARAHGHSASPRSRSCGASLSGQSMTVRNGGAAPLIQQTWFERWERPSCCTALSADQGSSRVMCTRRRWSEKKVRVTQRMQIGPHIPVGTQRYKAAVGPNYWANVASF